MPCSCHHRAPWKAQGDHAAGVFRHASEAIIISDAANRIIDVNPAFEELTGRGREAVLGETPALFFAQCLEAATHSEDCPSLQSDGRCKTEVTYLDRRGEACPAVLSISRVRDDRGAVSHHVMVLSDLAALTTTGRQAAREVYFDRLTGLPNLQLLTQLIHESLQHVDQHGGSLTVCSLDIDHFKAANDHLGRETGDLLLSTFAHRVGHLLHGDDVLARIGGDEFVLVLHHRADEAEFERLLEAIRQPLFLKGELLNLTASVGVSFYPGDDVTGDILLRHATQAMYRAKQRGRNTFHVFDPALDRELQVRQEQRQRFSAALAGHELCLHYQPQVDITDGRVVGVEALVRWQHPEQGLLAPGRFLPMIEGSPLETALGEWVLDAALAQLAAWQREGIDLPVHVNISPSHLLSGDFGERLSGLLARHRRVPARRLKLEVLETAAMHDIQAAQATMEHCQSLGIDFAIDDFGTGFSSLTNLRRLPVDLIKIDQSFVCGMLEDPDDRAIVESVVYMARRFGRPLLAEGVETLEHARALMALGCPLAQGYGIARPMPASRLPAWLQAWTARTDWHAIGMS
ncbi:phosphodiesterase [Halomonas nitroreducens]|uniref:Phosphodiesterase n=2 Tax=Halomonas nitroreducens TaxID=447425 RepID=A0A3S0R263_9GAMM|nr:phosphodiesterase [Halomonas nitroreducens]